jgi:hypothetical protein
MIYYGEFLTKEQ